MALYEKRVPFKSQVVSLLAKEQYEPWFLRLNPRGEVPVLTDGVKVIPDSVRIVEYLEDNFSNGWCFCDIIFHGLSSWIKD